MKKRVQWAPSCSTRTDGHTHMTNLIVALRSFANAPEYYRQGAYRRRNSLESSGSWFRRHGQYTHLHNLYVKPPLVSESEISRPNDKLSLRDTVGVSPFLV